MPKNMRSYTLRQWLSHSENTTGESQKPVLDLYQEPHDSRGTTFNVIRMITVIINMMIACLIIRFDLMVRLFPQSHVMTGWEVAGEYVYTTPGDQDVDNQMLTLKVPGYRSEVLFKWVRYIQHMDVCM